MARREKRFSRAWGVPREAQVSVADATAAAGSWRALGRPPLPPARGDHRRRWQAGGRRDNVAVDCLYVEHRAYHLLELSQRREVLVREHQAAAAGFDNDMRGA